MGYKQIKSELDRMHSYRNECEQLINNLPSNGNVEITCGGITICVPAYSIEPLLSQIVNGLGEEINLRTASKLKLN